MFPLWRLRPLRMKNWVDIVRCAVRAEIPEFEIFNTMGAFLDDLHNMNQRRGDEVIRRLSIFFNRPAAAWLRRVWGCKETESLV